jgi:predicted PolB exonuclease-like 3'-5' exonuclease
MKHLKEAYDGLRSTSAQHIAKSIIDEKRENADLICLQILQYLLDMKNYDGFIKMYRSHFHAYKTSFETINSLNSPSFISLPLQKIEELKWRANWHMIIAQMLDLRPTIFNEYKNIYHKNQSKSKYGPPTSNWLSET